MNDGSNSDDEILDNVSTIHEMSVHEHEDAWALHVCWVRQGWKYTHLIKGFKTRADAWKKAGWIAWAVRVAAGINRATIEQPS